MLSFSDKMLRDFIAGYLEKSTLHGLRFIVQKKCHWTERAVWVACCLAAWAGAGALVAAAWEAYRLHPISFGVSTAYLRWDTAFPAVTVCERNNRPRAYAYSERLFGAGRNPLVDELLNEMAFFPYSEAPYLAQLCGLGGRPPRMRCPQDGLREMARESLLGGAVFLLVERTTIQLLPTFPSSGDRDGAMFLTEQHPHKGPEELPSLGAERQALPWLREGHLTLRRVSVREMSNAGGVAAVAPELRRCRFPWEPLPGAPPASRYSYGGCVAACRRARERELCGCYLHLAPAHDGYKHPYASPCCRTSNDELKGTNHAQLTIQLDRLATEREHRLVVTGPLDVVVSVGSAFSLLVGASMQSVVEALLFVTAVAARAARALLARRPRSRPRSRPHLLRHHNSHAFVL
ncbi:uncharacterized protein GBIM_17931 [Gryllus bimaculatus]|nr:uncharacterized protein GBIM_17931 [Gryllus bimaculatus]